MALGLADAAPTRGACGAAVFPKAVLARARAAPSYRTESLVSGRALRAAGEDRRSATLGRLALRAAGKTGRVPLWTVARMGVPLKPLYSYFYNSEYNGFRPLPHVDRIPL